MTFVSFYRPFSVGTLVGKSVRTVDVWRSVSPVVDLRRLIFSRRVFRFRREGLRSPLPCRASAHPSLTGPRFCPRTRTWSSCPPPSSVEVLASSLSLAGGGVVSVSLCVFGPVGGSVPRDLGRRGTRQETVDVRGGLLFGSVTSMTLSLAT